jgi:pyruvate/2-oxoglutarate dehydrogenase complex dihydrolipoamide dehydrogenase (E3) component
MQSDTLIKRYGPRESMEYDVVIVGGGPAGGSVNLTGVDYLLGSRVVILIR